MGQFTDMLTNQAGNTIGNAVDAGMGLLLEGHNDRRQINQQQKLTNMQLNANEAMSKFNYDQQFDMWNKTNYEAQMQHIKNAGLNPALMYGGSGGGGTTTGSGSGGGGIIGAQAPSGGNEALGMMLKNNIAMQSAQIDVMKSEANKNNAEAAATTGYKQDLATTTIEQIKASTTNTEAQTALTNIQTALANIEKDIKADISDKGYVQGTMESNIDKVNQETMQIQNSNWIFNQTKEDVIKTIKQSAINSVLTGAAIKEGIKLNEAQIKNMANQISLQGQQINIQKFATEYQANHPEVGKTIGSMLQSVKMQIDKIFGLGTDYTAPEKIK